ncbi:MAG: trypsin-like peptidase domain-containing protein [Anaerolineales bacterium]|nr:trypsin-like peptidase domain-containing protein [Anaerolineales bacterium]
MMFNSKNRIFLLTLTLVLSLTLTGCLGLLLGEEEIPPTKPQEEELQPTEPPAESAEEETTQPEGLVTNLQDVKSAVIQIEAQGTFVDPDFGEYVGAGRGTGFIIDPSGLAVTNNHVVTGAALLKVWVGGERETAYNAKIIAVSECSDLALIDLEGDGYPYLSWYSDPVQVGLEVYAAGYPLGDPEYTLTKGIVSKENASGETSWASVSQVIEHDATINPGNSGGPLVTADGQVVGVNYATYAEANQYFAIGRETAQDVLARLESGADFDSLGINGSAVISDDGTFSGIWIYSVKSGSPAGEAGLIGGDMIASMENLPLAADGTMSDYCDIIRTQGADSTLAVEVFRFPEGVELEGQINGSPLSVVSAPDSPTDPAVNQPPTSQPSGGTITVSDDTGALVINVPASWNELDGRLWEADWDDLHFVAASLQAAPDLEAFKNSYSASGVDFAASRDWGAIGGYIQLLDGVEHWFTDSCIKEGRYDYEDEVYEGSYDLWECAVDEAVVVLAARPTHDPTAFLTLVQVQIITDDDIDALESILASFDVVDSLP